MAEDKKARDEYFRFEEERRRREREERRKEEEHERRTSSMMSGPGVLGIIDSVEEDVHNIQNYNRTRQTNDVINRVNTSAEKIYTERVANGENPNYTKEDALTAAGYSLDAEESTYLSNADTGVKDGRLTTQEENVAILADPNVNRIRGVVEKSFTSTDVVRGYKELGKDARIAINAGFGEATYRAAVRNNARQDFTNDFGRDFSLSLKKDIENRHKESIEKLKSLNINVKITDEQLDRIIKNKSYLGKPLSDSQMEALVNEKNLRAIEKGANAKNKHQLANAAVFDAFRDSDVYQGLQKAQTIGRVATGSANFLISAPTHGASKIAGRISTKATGDKKRVATSISDGLARFSNQSLAGKISTVASTPFRIAGNFIKKTNTYGKTVNKIKNSKLYKMGGDGLQGFKDTQKWYRQKISDFKDDLSKTAFGKAFKLLGKVGDVKVAIKKFFGKLLAFIGIIAVGLTLFVSLIGMAAASVSVLIPGTTMEDGTDPEKNAAQELVDDMYAKQKAYCEIIKYGSVQTVGLPTVSWLVNSVNGEVSKDGIITYLSKEQLFSAEYLGIDNELYGFKNIKPQTMAHTDTQTKVTTEIIPGETTYYHVWKYNGTQVDAIYTDFTQTKIGKKYTFSTKGTSYTDNTKPPIPSLGKTNTFYFMIDTDLYKSTYTPLGIWSKTYKASNKNNGEWKQVSKNLEIYNYEVTAEDTSVTTTEDITSTVYAYAGSDGINMYGDYIEVMDGGISPDDYESPAVNIDYVYKKKDGSLATQGDLYKGIVAITASMTKNCPGDKDYIYAMGNYLMRRTIEDGSIYIKIDVVPSEKTFYWTNGTEDDNGTMVFSDTAYKEIVNVQITSTIDFEKLLDYANEWDYQWHADHIDDINDLEFDETEYQGFGYLVGGNDENLTEYGDSAYAFYCYDNETWEDFGVIFPGNGCGTISEQQIDNYIEQIKANNGGLSERREDMLRSAFSLVGAYYYKMPPSASMYSSDGNVAKASSASDCSSFVSVVLWDSGVRSNYEHKTTADLKGMGAQTSVSALQPGDIIVHYTMSYDDWVAGGQQGAYNNHVIIYAGEFDNGDGSVVKRFVECTTYGNCSGSQITSIAQNGSWLNGGACYYYRNVCD